MGSSESVAFGLDGLAAVAVVTGDAERAARLLGAADAALEDAETTLQDFEVSRRAETMASVREALDPARVAAAYAAGRALTGGEAVVLALADGAR